MIRFRQVDVVTQWTTQLTAEENMLGSQNRIGGARDKVMFNSRSGGKPKQGMGSIDRQGARRRIGACATEHWIKGPIVQVGA